MSQSAEGRFTPTPDNIRIRLQEAEVAEQLAHEFSLISKIIPRFNNSPVFTIGQESVSWQAQRNTNGSFSITRTEVFDDLDSTHDQVAVESLVVDCDEFPTMAFSHPRISYKAGISQTGITEVLDREDLMLPTRSEDATQVNAVASIAQDFVNRFTNAAFDSQFNHYEWPYIKGEAISEISKTMLQYFSEKVKQIPGFEPLGSYVVNEPSLMDLGNIDELTTEELPFYRILRAGSLLALYKVSADTDGIPDMLLTLMDGRSHESLLIKTEDKNDPINSLNPRRFATVPEIQIQSGFTLMKEFLQLAGTYRFPPMAEVTPGNVLERIAKYPRSMLLKREEKQAAATALIQLFQDQLRHLLPDVNDRLFSREPKNFARFTTDEGRKVWTTSYTTDEAGSENLRINVVGELTDEERNKGNLSSNMVLTIDRNAGNVNEISLSPIPKSTWRSNDHSNSPHAVNQIAKLFQGLGKNSPIIPLGADERT